MSEANENLWELIYAPESLGFHLEDDPATGYQLRTLVEALSTPYQPVYELLRSLYALLYDPDEIPAEWLPYSAQHVGVIPTPEMDEEHLRAEIKQPTGWRRGELASIKLAVQKTLTGTKRVIVRSRTPEVGHHYVRTMASETPEPARTARVVRENVPAWEMLDFEAISGVDLVDLESAWPKSLAEIEGKFTTLADIEDTLPTELPE